jgi:hypothetical protein
MFSLQNAFQNVLGDLSELLPDGRDEASRIRSGRARFVHIRLCRPDSSVDPNLVCFRPDLDQFSKAGTSVSMKVICCPARPPNIELKSSRVYCASRRTCKFTYSL